MIHRVLSFVLAAFLSSALPAAADGIEVYFSPGASHTGGANSTIKTALLNFLGSATKTIDIAVFNLQDREIIEKLNTIAAAGQVTVRVIVDDVNYPVRTSDGTLSLSGSIASKKDDDPSSEMHHKFVVVDRGESATAVWTGSANFNRPNLTTMNNNAVILRSSTVSAAYAAEFEKMWNGSFHTAKTASTTTSFTVAGVPVEVRMAPQDAPITAMTSAVGAATTSAFYAIYTFGNSGLANALIAKKSTWGSNFFGLYDEDQVRFNFTSQYTPFVSAGMEVAQDANTDNLHHKFLVLDGLKVYTGSANFTVSANASNDENSVMIQDAAVARAYLAELARISGRTIGSITASDWKESVSIGTATSTPVSTSISEPARNASVAISYPNPFDASRGASVTIAPQPAATVRSVRILTLDGRLVYSTTPQGGVVTAITWDGRNAQGNRVASGSYLVEIETQASGVARGMMTLVR